MPLTRLVLKLGRNPDAGFPEGDDRTGYILVAPLDGEGRLDPDLWKAHKEKCKVIRFTPDDEKDADGWLTHRGKSWWFRYDEEEEGPNEPIFRLGDHRLRLGDYVTVHEADGDNLTYKITEARPI